MNNLNKYFPSMRGQTDPATATRAAGWSAEDADHETGMYRSARDYPLHDFAHVEFAEVEENAHNPAYYDAAEALDMN